MEKLFEDAKRHANISFLGDATIEQLTEYGKYIKEHHDEYDCSQDIVNPR